MMIASNGTDSRLGSLTEMTGRWVEWKRIAREDEPRRVSRVEVMLRGTCDPTLPAGFGGKLHSVF